MHPSIAPKVTMNSIVPITRFNRGEASKIFEEVAATGAKVVLKNNVPACVLLSPEEYTRLIDALEDQALLYEAEARLALDDGKLRSHAEVMENLGITKEDLEDVEAELE